MVERDTVSVEEWAARVDLAACYRIVDRMGWSDLIFNHITARVPGTEDHLLINPFGLLYSEVRASNLVRIDLDGRVCSPTEWPINEAGALIHTAVHSARPDVHCVIHTHTTAGSAIAGLEEGLDGNNFYSAQLASRVAYHDFEGITVDPGEMERLANDLGKRWVMILRNHGLLGCGRSIPEAFIRMWELQRACEVQLTTLATGRPIREITQQASTRSTRSVGRFQLDRPPGVALFEAMRRGLDPCYAL